MLHTRNLLALGLCAGGLVAQIIPGNSVATVINAGTTLGEMYQLDHTTRTSNALTISTALATDRTNCVLMTSPVTGFVGTNPLPANTPGNVYSITVSGSTVTETKLNSTATAGGNVAQIGIVGTNLWFTTQNATGTGGILQSVPAAGGPVTTALDLTTLSGWTGLANALCVVGTKVYVGAFDSSATAATPGCIAVYDTVANTGSVLVTLPPGKFVSGTSVFNTGLVHMQNVGGDIHAIGVYGDYLVYTTAGVLKSHEFSGAINGATTTTNLTNSADYDPNTGDMILGSRDGACDRVVSGQGAEKLILGVGSNPTATSNSVSGLSHVPAIVAAKDESYGGAGCPGNGGFYLTDVPSGLPTAGNTAFGIGVVSGNGGDPVACLISGGATIPPFDLSVIGMTACNLHLGAIVTNVPGALVGAGNGLGQFRFPLPIPASALGAVIYRQWAEVQITPTNTLGVVVSNARKTSIL